MGFHLILRHLYRDQLIQVLCDLIFGIVVAAFHSRPISAEVGMYLSLLGLLLAGLLLQRTLHTLVRFASCHRSDLDLGGLCRHNFGNNRYEEAPRIMRE